MSKLDAIRASDEYLDALSQCKTLPLEWQDQLSQILVGWVKEVRYDERKSAFGRRHYRRLSHLR